MKSSSLLSLLALMATAVVAQVTDSPLPPLIDGENCEDWKGADYGDDVECTNNNMVVCGSCGSGKDPDCSGDYDEIYCCALQDYESSFHTDDASCKTYHGGYGSKLYCEGHDVVVGVCGSGKDADCSDGSYHEIKCCPGVFDDGTWLTNEQSCYWTYGGYGVRVLCNHPEEAVFGRCGSGKDPDCDGNYIGVYCCKIGKDKL